MEFLFKGGKVRRVILLIFDLICFSCINALYYFATKFFETSPVYAPDAYFQNSVLLFATIFIFRLIFGVYKNVWRYTRTKSYFLLVFADFCAGALSVIISRAFFVYEGIWHFSNVASISALFAITARFAYRLLYKQRSRRISRFVSSRSLVNVAIIGAGQLGATLASELTNNKTSMYRPIFFVDRDSSKVGSRVYGLPVYYEDTFVLEQLKRDNIREVFIAIGDIDSDEAARIYHFYNLSGCKIKIYDVPLRDALHPTEEPKRTIREFQIEDLLFRDPIKIGEKEEYNYYAGKVVLVTGGGGSIGSELCRQIAKCNPKKLVIFDIYENNAYDIQQELVRNYDNALDLSVEIGSVRDRERLETIFSNYRPDVVFHAAAHKHVPLMEQSGCEAVKNNVLGTYNTADMAEKYEVEKFILISTDKAVNPTNIMGASKRLCEMVVQCRNDSKTCFAAVRFGNVLGSNGSVIPLFKRQIANGGPITITDKRIIRYFMTIPEASQLVMAAGAMAKKGELFVLDMGKPVRIYDLAMNMIRLSGFEPEVDIKIEEIGLRPGEKLYEELLMKTEDLDKTENDMIFIERDAPLTREDVDEKLRILERAVDESRATLGSAKIKAAIAEVVPTFREPEVINSTASTSDEMKAVSST